jgi:hypothetical protein
VGGANLRLPHPPTQSLRFVVDFFMRIEIARSGEALAALRTHVRFFPGVRPRVYREVNLF